MNKFYILIPLIFCLNIHYSSQEEFKINFSIEYNLTKELEHKRSKLPIEMVIYTKEGFSKKEETTELGSQTLINNFNNNESYLLMEIKNEKLAIKLQTKNKSNAIKEKISYLNETKNIVGYKCKKAILNTYDVNEEEANTIELFYTNEIKGFFDVKFQNINGFPLQYALESNGMSIIYTASNIEVKKMNIKTFEIPDNYKVLSMNQFQQMMLH